MSRSSVPAATYVDYFHAIVSIIFLETMNHFHRSIFKLFLSIPSTVRTVLFYIYVLPLLTCTWMVLFALRIPSIMKHVVNILRGDAEPRLNEHAIKKYHNRKYGTNTIIAGNCLRDVGPKDAPAMVFLHGFPECWYSWRHQISEFSDRYRCIALEMPGYCNYHTSHSEFYRPSRIADEVMHALAALGISDFILVGHDWGGMIAYHIAASYPQNVKKLIIMDCPHPVKMIDNISFEQTRRSLYFLLFQMPWLPELYFRMNHCEFVATILNMGRNSQSFLTEDDISILQWKFYQGSTPTCSLNYYRNLFSGTLAEFQLYESELPMPTLILWGSEDVALLPSLNDNIYGLVPRAEVVVIPSGSHWIQQDRPLDVNRHMTKFLTEKVSTTVK